MATTGSSETPLTAHRWITTRGTTRTCRTCGTVESATGGKNAKGARWGSTTCDGGTAVAAKAAARHREVTDRLAAAEAAAEAGTKWGYRPSYWLPTCGGACGKCVEERVTERVADLDKIALSWGAL